MAKLFHAELAGKNPIKVNGNNYFSAIPQNNVLIKMKVFLGCSLVPRLILTL